jgi:hypothetical protein
VIARRWPAAVVTPATLACSLDVGAVVAPHVAVFSIGRAHG